MHFFSFVFFFFRPLLHNLKSKKMKLKLFYVCLLVLFVANIFVSSSAQPEEPVDALLLENVEALADGEHGSIIHCLGVGTLDCPFNQMKVKMIDEEYLRNL